MVSDSQKRSSQATEDFFQALDRAREMAGKQCLNSAKVNPRRSRGFFGSSPGCLDPGMRATGLLRDPEAPVSICFLKIFQQAQEHRCPFPSG